MSVMNGERLCMIDYVTKMLMMLFFALRQNHSPQMQSRPRQCYCSTTLLVSVSIVLNFPFFPLPTVQKQFPDTLFLSI